MNKDCVYMSMAIKLAESGTGKVSPMPMVGAVIVKNGRIIGRGFHPHAGKPHAEIYSLQEAGSGASGATLYVSLEPCNHVGKTPPCTDAILRAGIKRVVAAVVDPNPLVSGKGIKKLKNAGIEVSLGILEKEAKALNEFFFHFIKTRRPFGILKTAMSLDGKIGTNTGESRWITGVEARKRVHEIRARVDAVAVGVGTVIHDDPLLTPRLVRPVSYPWRLVIDSSGRTPANARILKPIYGKKTIIVVTDSAPVNRLRKLEKAGAEIMKVARNLDKVCLSSLFDILGQRQIISVLIEGGSEIYASALRENVVQKIVCFVAPIVIGGRDAPSMVGGQGISKLSEVIKFSFSDIAKVGSDWMITAYIQ